MRPATYENAAEAEVLSKWFSGRDGDLENTTFALLDPSGERALARRGRSPSMAYGDAARFAKALNEFAGEYKAKKGERSLPEVADLRLGLNVAASDGLPLVVGVGKEKDLKALRDAAWHEGIQGQAHYVALEDGEALEELEGYKKGDEVFVIQPETFGRTGKIIAHFDLKERKLDAKLAAVLPGATIKKDVDRVHVRNARRAGISWKSAIPVSDGAAARREQSESDRPRRGGRGGER